MQWTGLNELREKYLHYFETKGHLRLGSFRSLVGGLVAAAGAAQGEKYASYALTLSVLASTAVGVLMTLTGGIVALPLIGIVLYQAAWLVITLFFPLMQR